VHLSVLAWHGRGTRALRLKTEPLPLPIPLLLLSVDLCYLSRVDPCHLMTNGTASSVSLFDHGWRLRIQSGRPGQRRPITRRWQERHLRESGRGPGLQPGLSASGKHHPQRGRDHEHTRTDQPEPIDRTDARYLRGARCAGALPPAFGAASQRASRPLGPQSSDRPTRIRSKFG